MKAGEKWPPIKLMFVAAVVRKHANVKFLDGDNLSMNEPTFLSWVRRYSPDLIITEPTLPSLEHELEVVKEIKGVSGAKVALIGDFTGGQPKEILIKSEVDYIVQGEAEAVVEDLVRKKQTQSIKGLWYKDGRSIKFNGRRGFVKDLDTLPFPAHDLLPLKAYTSFFIKWKPFTLTESSRGCSYSCTFCNAWVMNGKIPRFRSVNNMMEELRWIKSLGIKGIFFIEETFTLEPKRLRNLLNSMINEGLNLTWACTTRADVVDKGILALMKRAGCHIIFFGVESGNQNILDYYNKGVSLEQTEKTFKNCRDVGITTLAQLIVGAPQESLKTVKSTADFAIKIKADYMSMNFLTPYFGTEVAKDLVNRGLLKEGEWSSSDQTASTTLRTEHLDTEGLEKAMKYAYKRFYLRPSYIVSRMKEVKSFGDFARISKGFVNALDLIK